MALRVSSVYESPESFGPALTSFGDFDAFFTTGSFFSLSSSKSSGPVSAGLGDFGAFLGSVCILFTIDSCSSSSLSESSDSVSTNSGDFGAFWGCLCVLFIPQISLSLFLHVVPCSLPKDHFLI